MRQILGKEFEASPVEFSNLLSGLNDNLLSDNQFKVLQGFFKSKRKITIFSYADAVYEK